MIKIVLTLFILNICLAIYTIKDIENLIDLDYSHNLI